MTISKAASKAPLLFAFAALVVGLVLFVTFAMRSPEPAGASGPSMGFQVYSDTGKTNLVCDLGAFGRTCQLETGSTFSVDVIAVQPPASGYSGYRVLLQFGPDVNLVQQAGLDENRAPKCNVGSEQKDVGMYTISCKVAAPGSGDLINYDGTLVNVHFACKDGSAQIDLVAGIEAGVSVYTQATGTGSVIQFLKSQAKGGKQIADSVTIDCVPPTPTPTNTPTPTPTPTDTPTPTPTPTPTDTPTPTPTPTTTDTPTPTPTATKECNLSSSCATVTPTPTTTPPVGSAGCTPGYWKNHKVAWGPTGVDPSESFESVFGTSPEPFNADPAYQEALGFGGGGLVALSRHAGAALLNALHPSVPFPLSPIEITLAYQAAVASQDAGKVEALKDGLEGLNEVGCSINAQGTPIPADEPLQEGEEKPVPVDTDLDGVTDGEETLIVSTDPFASDTDADGCSDGRELSNDPATGGQRDPLNHWDFYDVSGEGGGPPDGIIDLPNDILGVIQHFAPSGAAPYDVQFDRGVSSGPHPWNMTAPDGVIDLPNDILGVILQFNHDCR